MRVVVFAALEESGEGGRQCYYFAFLPHVPLFFLRMRISNQLKVWINFVFFYVAPYAYTRNVFQFGQRYLLYRRLQQNAQ